MKTQQDNTRLQHNNTVKIIHFQLNNVKIQRMHWNMKMYAYYNITYLWEGYVPLHSFFVEDGHKVNFKCFHYKLDFRIWKWNGNATNYYVALLFINFEHICKNKMLDTSTEKLWLDNMQRLRATAYKSNLKANHVSVTHSLHNNIFGSYNI